MSSFRWLTNGSGLTVTHSESGFSLLGVNNVLKWESLDRTTVYLQLQCSSLLTTKTNPSSFILKCTSADTYEDISAVFLNWWGRDPSLSVCVPSEH